MQDRLNKPQTEDVVFKIKINNVVCELQLAMEQKSSSYQLNHCLYELLRSPLGVIFGSYIFKSKGVKDPLVQNCKELMKSGNKTKDNIFNGMKLLTMNILFGTMLEEQENTKDNG